MYDVIIIGGGPAGLSAALILGRCCRRVLVIDSRQPRNGASRHLHGFLTRDGASPWSLRARGEADLRCYTSVAIREGLVVDISPNEKGFHVTDEVGASAHAHLLLLATGRADPLPNIPGVAEFFGNGVFHCPYCDGWEHRNQPLAVFGRGQGAADLAAELLTWSDRVTICTNGAPLAPTVPPRQVHVITTDIQKVEGSAKGIERLHFVDGKVLPCKAVFFCTECIQRSHLPARLGCRFDSEESVICEGHQAAGVPGLFIAGNVRGGVHLAITAAAEGAEAALAMNDALLAKDFERAGTTLYHDAGC